MTQRTLTLRSGNIPSAFPSFHKFGVGFEDIFDDLARQHEIQTNNYPPHNLVKISEDLYFIEIATAGFSEGEVTVNLDNRILTVVGKKNDEDASYEYLHRGLSSRDFEKQFTLAEHVEITSANVKNGILTINLERQIPEDKKPKTIDITFLS